MRFCRHLQKDGLCDNPSGAAMSNILNLSPLVAGDHRPLSTTLGTRRASPAAVTDYLSRNVYGLLGLPLDAINFPNLLQSVEQAVEDASPLLISTPNVNFLITSQKNNEFRESILQSDLCLADGMPLIWIAKLLQVPINERIAGSDLFGRLKSAAGRSRQLKVF